MALLALWLPFAASAGAATNEPSRLDVERMREDLRSGDWLLQAAAMQRAADGRQAESAEAIRGIFDGKGTPWLRARALVALARLHGKVVLPDVLACRREADAELREAAVESLGILREGADSVKTALADPDARVRRRAVLVYARVAPERAWREIKPFLDDKDPETVRCAILAAGAMPGEETATVLLGLLKSDNAAYRAAAAEALGLKQVKAAVPALLGCLAEGNEVAAAAETALFSYSDADLEPLLCAAITDRFDAVVQVLQKRPLPRAVAAADAALRKGASVSPAALDMLAAARPDAYQDLFLRNLAHSNAAVAASAVTALGACTNLNLYQALRPVLVAASPDLRLKAYAVLRSRTTGEPPGGIVAYLGNAMKADPTNAMDLMIARVSKDSVAQALSVLSPWLAGSDDARRLRIAESLGKQADEALQRKIAAAQGFIMDWKYIGPFPALRTFGEMAQAFPPEFDPDTEAPCAIPEFGYGADARVDKGNKFVTLKPPVEAGEGSITLLYRLALPEEEKLRLEMKVALEKPKIGNGVLVTVAADGGQVLSSVIATNQDGFVSLAGDLTAWAGKTVSLALTVDSRGDTAGDGVRISDASVAADKPAWRADLIELAPTAMATIRCARIAPDGRLEWKPARVNNWRGDLDFRSLGLTTLFIPTVYAAAEIVAEKERTVEVVADGWELYNVWFNGKLLMEKRRPGGRWATVTLRPGRNRFLFKIMSGVLGYDRMWSCRLRVVEKK